jgi:hypothetical protein
LHWTTAIPFRSRLGLLIFRRRLEICANEPVRFIYLDQRITPTCGLPTSHAFISDLLASAQASTILRCLPARLDGRPRRRAFVTGPVSSA